MRPVRLVYIDLVCIINCFRVVNLVSLASLVCLFNILQYKQADFKQKLQLKIIQCPGIVLMMQIISFDCSWSSRLFCADEGIFRDYANQKPVHRGTSVEFHYYSYFMDIPRINYRI